MVEDIREGLTPETSMRIGKESDELRGKWQAVSERLSGVQIVNASAPF